MAHNFCIKMDVAKILSIKSPIYIQCFHKYKYTVYMLISIPNKKALKNQLSSQFLGFNIFFCVKSQCSLVLYKIFKEQFYSHFCYLFWHYIIKILQKTVMTCTSNLSVKSLRARAVMLYIVPDFLFRIMYILHKLLPHWNIHGSFTFSSLPLY